METITIKSIFKDTYRTKRIIFDTLIGIYFIVFILRKYTGLGIVGILISVISIYCDSIISNQILKGKFKIIKQRVLGINPDTKSISLSFGNLETTLYQNLKTEDSVYILFEGLVPIMIYDVKTNQLDQEVSKHLLSDTETEEFIKLLNSVSNL